MRRLGCRIRWDLNLALDLWNAGTRVSEIARQAGTTEGAVFGAANRYQWPARGKPQGVRHVTVKRRCGCGAIYSDTLGGMVQHCASAAFASRYVA